MSSSPQEPAQAEQPAQPEAKNPKPAAENKNKGNNKNNGKNQPKGDGGKSKSKTAVQINLPPPPSFLEERAKLWDEYKKKQEEERKNLPDTPIKVTLPSGKVVDAIAWKTTPYEIAKGIKRSLADEVVVAKVDGKYHDIHRPLEGDCSIQLFAFDTPEGKHCFWHSSAHVLGQALEKKYGAHLTVGPALEEGFYYDSDIPAHPVLMLPLVQMVLSAFPSLVTNWKNSTPLPIKSLKRSNNLRDLQCPAMLLLRCLNTTNSSKRSSAKFLQMKLLLCIVVAP